MEQYTKWLVVLPLVLAVVKFASWLWTQAKNALSLWVNTLIDTKVQLRSDKAIQEHTELREYTEQVEEEIRGTLQEVDFSLREELQKLTLRVVDLEKETDDIHARLVKQETKMELFWGSVERNAAALLRDRSREE